MGRRSGAVVALALLLAACGGDSDSDGSAEPASSPTGTTESGSATTSSAPAATTPTSAEASASANPGTAVTTGDSDFGEMLFDTRGQAIYLFEPESDGTPDCYDECAASWPPVLTEGEPVGEGGLDGSLLGTVERDDGGTQVTYNDWPLYSYANEDPGQVLCHDVFLNGGLWLAVGPDGDPLPT